MSVGTTVPFIDDFMVIKGDQNTTLGGPVPEGKTRVVVLEFWATWCGPCVQSIPHLSELQREYKQKNLDITIVASTSEQDEQKIRNFVAQNNMEYTVVLDRNQSLRSKIFQPSGATGIPFAAIIVNNKIVHSGHPMDPNFKRQLESAAAKASLLKEPEALPLITMSMEELMQLRPRELRQILDDRGIKSTGLSEKSEFAQLILERCSKTQYYKH